MRISHLRPCLSLLGCFFSAALLHAATVTTLPATNLTGNSATLNAVANPGGQFVFGYFEYGTTASYGTRTTEQNLGSGTSNTNFSQLVTGLSGPQTFHFRADVANVGLPLATGADQTFFVPAPPLVTTIAAAPIHPGEAQLNATINPYNLPTAYWFQYGLTVSYGSFTPTNTLPAGTNVISVNALLTGLVRSTNYHFRIIATNALGQSIGSDQSFAVPGGVTAPSGSTGGGAPFNLGEPSTAVNFLICTQGIYQGSPPAFPLIGAICLFAGNFAPAGWCLCQGQLLNVNSNATLFNLIGTTYGGDGQTTFALPDFRGCRAVHVGTGWILSERSGSAQTTLTVSQLPVHTHSLPAPYTITGTAGSGQPFGIDQPYLVINYMMALEGIYPQSAAPVSEPFLGQIFLFAPNLLPSGYSFLNGQALSVNQNEALYSLLGTNYGGNGQTTFNEPNLQARSPLGAGQGPFTLRSIAQVTGADIVTLSLAQLPAHQHAAPTLGTLTGSAGSNQPISLMNPSLVLQYLISTNGQIPSPTVQAANAMMGEIELYAGTNVPGGWLPCDGRSMPIASNPGLFGVISNFYGGDGLTTFALPNLAGRTAVGATNSQPGASSGAEQVALTTANLPPHTHSIPVIDYDFWITSYNLSGAAAGFSANADADTAANGYEWATGTNPTNSQSLAPLAISSSSGYAMVNFPRNTNATDVIFTLQSSTNLANPVWTGVATNTAGIWSSPAAVTETGSTNPVTVTVSAPLTNGPVANYRLQITWP
jgi:microcystin-dependent protein